MQVGDESDLHGICAVGRNFEPGDLEFTWFNEKTPQCKKQERQSEGENQFRGAFHFAIGDIAAFSVKRNRNLVFGRTDKSRELPLN